MSLEPYPADCRQSQFEAPAPVNGGMRWRVAYGGLADYSRRSPDPLVEDAGGSPRQAVPPDPAPRPAARGPFITFTPPTEARAGEEYSVRAKAFDPCIVGFNWFFKKDCCPPGMTIDRYSGEIRWTPAEGGRFEVTLGCSTVHGSVAHISWTVCVRKAAVVRTPVPAPRFQSAVRRKTALIKAPRPPCIAWTRARRFVDPAARAAAPPGVARPVPYALRI